MPSPTKENYIKAIYALSQSGGQASTTSISEMMQISLPATSRMIKNLVELNLVNNDRSRAITLTREGNKMALGIIRKHRLIELYLTQKMGFGWEEVHDIAEEMEHIRSEAFFERIDKLLGHPKIDPHGSPIPDHQGNMISRNYFSLDQARKETVVAVRTLLDDSKELLIQLNSLQIGLNSELRILSKETYDDSMRVKYDGHESQTLSLAICQNILVELVSDC